MQKLLLKCLTRRRSNLRLFCSAVNAHRIVLERINDVDLSSITEHVKTSQQSSSGFQTSSTSKWKEIEAEYRTFLYIMASKLPNETMVISPDVSQFWRTHILHTRQYMDDCRNVFGYYLHHADVVETPAEDNIDQVERSKINAAQLVKVVGVDDHETALKAWPIIDALNLGHVRHNLAENGGKKVDLAEVEWQYKVFLLLMACKPADRILLPWSRYLKAFWQEHIASDTLRYMEDCNKIFGCYIHYEPKIAIDVAMGRLALSKEAIEKLARATDADSDGYHPFLSNQQIVEDTLSNRIRYSLSK